MARMESTVNPIRFPDMRANLHGFSESLSDEAYQNQVWIEHQLSATRDSFTDVIHFFYDDTTLAEHPDQWLGLILRNASEVDAVKALVSAMDLLFAKMGTEEPDETYLRSADWPQVVTLARRLVAQLDQSDGSARVGDAALRIE